MLKPAPQDRLTIGQIVSHPAMARHVEDLKKPISKTEHEILIRNFLLNLQGNSHRVIPDAVTQELTLRKSQSINSETPGQPMFQNSHKVLADLQDIKKSILTTENSNTLIQEYRPRLESKRDIAIDTSYKIIPLEKSFLESVRSINPEDVVPVVEDNFFFNLDPQKPLDKFQPSQGQPIVRNAEQMKSIGFHSARQSNAKPEIITRFNPSVRSGVQGQVSLVGSNLDSRNSKISKSTNPSRRRIDFVEMSDMLQNSRVFVKSPNPVYTRQEPISTQLNAISTVSRQGSRSPVPNTHPQGQLTGKPLLNQIPNVYYGIPQNGNIEKRGPNFGMAQNPLLQHLPVQTQNVFAKAQQTYSPVHRPFGKPVQEPALNFARPVVKQLNDLGAQRVLAPSSQEGGYRVRAISATRNPVDGPLNSQVYFKK
jgi:hypothetical protein